MTATNGVTCHHRHDRFRAATNIPLEIQDVKMMYTAVIFVAAVIAAYFLVATGTEGFFAFTGQHDDTDFFIKTGISKRGDHFFYGLRTERVAHFRTINGDFGNAVSGFVITNVGVTRTVIHPLNRCI